MFGAITPEPGIFDAVFIFFGQFTIRYIFQRDVDYFEIRAQNILIWG